MSKPAKVNRSAVKEKPLIERLLPLACSESICKLLDDADPQEAAQAKDKMLAKHNEWIRNMDHRVGKHNDRIVIAEGRIDKAVKRLSAIEPHEVEKMFASMQARVAFLGDRLALLITKCTAATEIPWLVSRMRTGKDHKPLPDERIREFQNLANSAVIRALDYPDSWWREHGNRSMGDLLDALLDAYRKDIWSEASASDAEESVDSAEREDVDDHS